MTPSRFQFSGSEDERLAECVSRQPAIFDPAHRAYKDHIFRDAVWREISFTVRRSVEDCKKRWRNMRDTHSRHMRNSRKQPRAAAKPKSSKWGLAEQLSFLKNVESERRTPCIQTTDNSDCEDGEETEMLKQETNSSSNKINALGYPCHLEDASGETECDPSVSSATHDDSNVTETHLNFCNKRIKLNEDILQLIEQRCVERLEFKRETRNCRKQMETGDDPVDAFLRSMALSIKKFPPALIAEAKMKICNIVTEMELRTLQPPLSSPLLGNSNQAPVESLCNCRQEINKVEKHTG